MLFRLIRFFRRWPRREAVESRTGQPSDHRVRQRVAQMQEDDGKAWWAGKTSAVGETDEQLVVIGPRVDAGRDAYRALGTSIREWHVTRSYARHIWGLEDLLQGSAPRTPPIYLCVPYPCERFAEQFEPVALVFVAAGTDKKVAADDLARHLEAQFDTLACFEDPESYSRWRR
jgi:hypothetical protein